MSIYSALRALAEGATSDITNFRYDDRAGNMISALMEHALYYEDDDIDRYALAEAIDDGCDIDSLIMETAYMSDYEFERLCEAVAAPDPLDEVSSKKWYEQHMAERKSVNDRFNGAEERAKKRFDKIRKAHEDEYTKGYNKIDQAGGFDVRHKLIQHNLEYAGKRAKREGKINAAMRRSEDRRFKKHKEVEAKYDDKNRSRFGHRVPKN